MSRLTQRRAPLRTQLTKLETSVKLALTQPKDPRDLKIKFEKLETLWCQLEEADKKVLEELFDSGADDDAIQAELSSCETYQDVYLALKIDLREAVEPQGNTNQNQGARGTVQKRKVKLPEFKLMQYDGDLKNWQNWWSQFKQIHDMPAEEVDNSTKFQLLLTATKEGSKAHDIVSSYFQSSDSYGEAISALKDTFGRDDLQLQVSIRELLSLVISNVTKKEKMPLPELQLKLQSQLRSLATLKLNNADPSTWLFPLVESSLAEETIRAWQRSDLSKKDGSAMNPPKTRLDLLMDFITGEVRSEQQITLAQSAFQEVSISENSRNKGKGSKAAIVKKGQDVATAAGLVAGQVTCIFCDGKHDSDRCVQAQSMSIEEKEEKVKAHHRCFRCLLQMHPKSKTGFRGKCKILVKCIICGGPHQTIMCRGEKPVKKDEQNSTRQQNSSVSSNSPRDPPSESDNVSVSSATASLCSSDVLLNIIQVKVKGEKGTTTVRLMGDTGSQLSYIREDVVKKVGLKQVGKEYLQNVLFGGSVSQPTLTGKYQVSLSNLKGEKKNEVVLFAKPQICGSMSRIPNGPWTKELEEKGIHLTDVGTGSADIDILIGSDYWGDLLTGKMLKLKCGLLAVETVLGWTISGRVPVSSANMAVTMTTSLLSVSDDITHLWSLEAIGIKDPIEVQSKEEEEQQALQHFRDNVCRDSDGRYIVALPWKVPVSSLPTNRNVAEKRLQRATTQLQKQEKFSAYDEVFRGWEKEGIIKEIQEENDTGHYLPHRPVFKDSLTTPVRPVFDASCKVGKYPSLNDCLYKGPNLLELIPTLLLRFRENQYGVSADIRKAFQMICVRDADQIFQKFLWWKDASCKEIKVYQHLRVVFGLNCSPFLLAATILEHLNSLQCQLPYADSEWLTKLTTSFYVDNLVSSVQSVQEYNQLQLNASSVLKEAGMELREWARNGDNDLSNGEAEANLSLLGLVWDRERDYLSCVIPEIEEGSLFTKKMVLSLVARVFDPLGFLCPALIPLKAIIQESWAEGIGWETVLPEETQRRIQKWISSILQLQQIKIPRQFQFSKATSREVHVFVDASSTAYAGVVYMRSTIAGGTMVQLMLAKSRLAPKQKKKKSADAPNPTIPRLELMGCVLGVRLASTVRVGIDCEGIVFFFWVDSTVARAWIDRHDHYGAFVGNRVEEIRKTTTSAQWRHVPGTMNPADLPSRGCNPKDLLKSTWWEEPKWLKGDRSTWPNQEEAVDEEAVLMERRKTTVLIAAVTPVAPRFSSYRRNVAVWGWVLRFINNCRKGKGRVSERVTTRFLKLPEQRKAELILMKEVQQQAFPGTENRIGGLAVKRGDDGLIRVQTRLLNRKDLPGFVNPILLPSSHPIVELLILDVHRSYHHGGVQLLMGATRYKYWILQTRRTIRRVLRKCAICRRHEAKPLEVVPGALPSRRVDNCDPFQTTGVDLFGPLYLKNGTKAWVVLFTCAYYRSIHLDPVLSLDTEAFLGALERFIAIYGRPNTIYSDNGTNFHGAVNLFKRLKWKDIEKDSNVKQLQWIFNPPTAAWWGGFWERLIRSVKDLLKRVLGKSKLDYDNLRTCLAGVCATINERPLTVVTEDNDDLIPLTPAMFLKRNVSSSFPETVGALFLQKGYLRMKSFQQQLQERFRKEYISLLVQRGHQPKRGSVCEGAVVLVGADNQKRFQWTPGIIVELMRGPDGEARRAKVRTSHGILERPLQRLYPMEINCADVEEFKTALKKKEISTPKKKVPEVEVPVQRVIVSQRGRVIRTPARYGQWPV